MRSQSLPVTSDPYVPRLGEPLGPDSLTWQLVGDYRWLLCGMRAGLLQTMHPAIDAALKQHDSTYFQGPMKRILRSLPQIQGVVFADDAAGVGAQVRTYHKPLGGKLSDGTPYHALNPDVFYWPHATFFEEQICAMEFFGTPLTEAEKERLFQESVQWYSLYGMSMKPVPANYGEFRQYWDHMVEDVLVVNGFARATKRTKPGVFGPSPYPFVPKALWRPASDAQFDLLMWITRGTLGPEVRDKIGAHWSDGDERRLRRFGTGLDQTFGRLPRSARMVPQARAAYRREAAR
jgi:uncharacterized protein (DUF2236 family)